MHAAARNAGEQNESGASAGAGTSCGRRCRSTHKSTRSLPRRRRIMRRSVVGVLVATGLLALPAGPATAGSRSCVGQFASTSAQQDGAAFGADISFGAQFASQPNFGAGVVAPFAHQPREAC
jgi:hypothetical protein